MKLRSLYLALFLALPATALADERLSRGAYLAKTGGCFDCHAPLRPGPKGPAPDFAAALAGHPEKLVMPPPPRLGEGPWLWIGSATNTAFAGPWGVSYAANLTPDRDTGIGAWREQDFIATMRTGRHLGVGRPILPPMPWHGYQHYTDADLKALFAWLQSQPAVRNRVPQPQPPTP